MLQSKLGKLMEIKSTDEKPNNCLFGYRSNDFINIDKFDNEISCFNSHLDE